MATDGDLLGIGLVLTIVAAVMVFAMGGSVYAGTAAVDLRQLAAAAGALLRSMAGITGL